MAKVVIYQTPQCSYCTRAKQLLDRKGVAYTLIDVSRDEPAREEMIRRSGRYTVPQIFIDDQPVGGFDDIYALEREGRLDALLGRG